MCACQTERTLPLPSITRASYPGVPPSTRNPLTCPSAVSRAHTTTTSASEPLPIHRFAPSITYSSPSRRAVVSSATESEPWSGSVSANAPSASIRAIGGSQRCFCSSEPNAAIERIASPAWTPRSVPRLPSPRLSSIWMSPAATALIGGQPYPSMPSPTSPSSPSRRARSSGSSARSQCPGITGSTSSSTNRRVRSR